jgi:hypothetical protein
MDKLDLDFNIDDMFIGDDTELEFDLKDFDSILEEKPITRYIKPKIYKLDAKIDYNNAKDIVKELKLFPGEQMHYIVSGNFIFGDFIEALLVEKNVICEYMYLSSLSLSQNNIDSIAGLMQGGYIDKITIMLSNYFYSHEKYQLMPYLLENLDIDNRLKLLIIRNHTKICLMKISNIFLTIVGSSNLRSSNSIEQFTIQESQELFEFYQKFFEDNEKYDIINQGVNK